MPCEYRSDAFCSFRALRAKERLYLNKKEILGSILLLCLTVSALSGTLTWIVEGEQLTLTCTARLDQTNTGVEQTSVYNLTITNTGSAKLGSAIVIIPPEYSNLSAPSLTSAPIDETWGVTISGHNISLQGSAEGLRTGENVIIAFTGRNPSVVGDYTWTVEATQNTGVGGHDYLPAFVFQFSASVTPVVVITVSSDEIMDGQSVEISSVLEGATAAAGGNVTYTLYSGTYPSGTEVDSITVTVVNGVVPDSAPFIVDNPGIYYVSASYSGDTSNDPFNGDNHVPFSVLAILTVNLIGSGTGKVNDGSTDHTSSYSKAYDYGSTITLTPTADAGSSFAGWSDDSTGLYPITLNLTSSIVVTATFIRDEYVLLVSGVGMGSVSVDPSQASYHYGDVVELSAVPDAGWSFGAWSGDLVDSANSVSVTITGNTAITATFVQDEYILSVSIVGMGTVAVSPSQSTYHLGDVVELTATPGVGWSLEGWSGDASIGAASVRLTVTRDMSVTVSFVQDEYILSVYVVGMGSVAVNPSLVTYHYGDLVELSAIPDEGWSFGGWSGDLIGLNSSTSVTITGSMMVTGVFSHNTLAIFASAGAHGSITPNGQVVVFYGEDQSFAIAADPHYHVARVLVDGASVGPVTSYAFIAVTENHNISVVFAVNTYSIEVVSAHGSPTVSGIVEEGENFTASVATPEGDASHRWICIGYSIDDSELTSGTEYAFENIDSNHTITFFWQEQYCLTVTSKHGTVTGSGWYDAGSSTYASLSCRIVSGIAGTRYVFAQWSGDASGASLTSNVILIDAAKTAVACWMTQYYVEWKQTGVDSSAVGTVVVINGSAKTFDALPFAMWVDDGTSVGYVYSSSVTSCVSGKRFDFASVTDPMSVIVVQNSATVLVNYDVLYQLDVFSEYGNPVGSGWYQQGSLAQFSVITPVDQENRTLRVFVMWSGDAGGTSASGSLVMTEPSSVVAAWETQYLVTFDTAVYGIVLKIPSVPETIPSGGDVFGRYYAANDVLSVGPAPDLLSGTNGVRYVWKGWTLDGEVATTGATLSFVVDGPHEASVVYGAETLLVVNAIGVSDPFTADLTIAASPPTVHELSPTLPIQEWIIQGGGTSLSISTPNRIGCGEWAIFQRWAGQVEGNQTDLSFAMTDPATVDAIFFKVNPVASSIPFSVIAAVATILVGAYVEKKKKKTERGKRIQGVAWGMAVLASALIVAIGVSVGIAVGYSINVLELVDFTNWAVVFVVVEAVGFLCGTVALMTWIRWRKFRLPM